jgi:hypothetical protein
MKIPSIVKLPKHKRFEYVPRYYDPIKDEINQKIAQAKRELEAEQNGTLNGEHYVGRIRGSFRKNSRISRQKADISQPFFVMSVLGASIAYYYYGNIAFWILAVMFPLYLLMKLRNR